MIHRGPARPVRRSPRHRPIGAGVIRLRSKAHHPRVRRSVKATPSAHKSSRLWPWLIMVLTIIGLLLVTGFGLFWAWQQLAGSAFDAGPYRVLVVSQPGKTGRNAHMYVLQFQTEPARMQVVSLPVEQQVLVAGGYGQYQLGAVQPLLQLDKKPASFINSTLSLSLQLPIDQVVTVGADDTFDDKSTLEKVLWQTRNWIWWRAVQRLSAETITFAQVSDSRELASKLEPYVPLQSQCAVAVVNATKTSGLASRYGQVLENGQILVVRLLDQAQQLEKSQIIAPESQVCQPVLRAIKATLPADVSVTTDPAISLQHRAEVVVFLGADHATLW